MSDFSIRLRNLRIEHGYTQETLAEAINKRYGTAFSKGTISKWESDTTSPSFQSIPMIANFFGVTTDYLIGVSDSTDSKFNAEAGTHDAVMLLKYRSLSDSDREIVDNMIDRLSGAMNQ